MGLKIGVGLFTGQIPEGSERVLHREYREYLDLVRLVESQGLDAAWVSEHHGSGDSYLPSLLPMLAAFAAVTERIELGTGVVLAPFHNPLRLAEDFAVVDQISGGRTIAGLGIGWREEEFRTWNIPIAARVRRLVETVEILRRAWAGRRFSYEGKYFRYSDVAVTPEPVRIPPIFVGGFVDDAIRRAGRIGDGYISSRADPERIAQSFGMAAEEYSKTSRADQPFKVGVLHNAFVTEDPERDWPMVNAGIGHQLGVYAGWRSGTDVPGTPLKVMPPSEEDIRRTTAYGTPEQVIEHLSPVVDSLARYDEGHLVLRLHYPGMAAEPAARAIELLAHEVVPVLREAARR
jgi:probable F420-dependent oxidoreductase